MKIYFACSITGGRDDQKDYEKIVELLTCLGHEVPTAMLASANLDEMEGAHDRFEVYERDTRWIRECDMIVAEVSTPSHGVGYEICYALNQGIPVICMYQQGRKNQQDDHGKC